MAAFTCPRERNTVNSLGPLGAGSTGGASPPGTRNTSVASLDPGRVMNGWLTGGALGGVREKIESAGALGTGVDRRGASGGAAGTPEGSKNGARTLALVPSAGCPGCDPCVFFPDGGCPNIWVNDPADACGG